MLKQNRVQSKKKTCSNKALIKMFLKRCLKHLQKKNRWMWKYSAYYISQKAEGKRNYKLGLMSFGRNFHFYI